MAAILKVWRQIENPTPSADVYLFGGEYCQISPWSDLKRRSDKMFWRGGLNQNKNNNKMNSDMRSVPDTKIDKFTKLQQVEFFIAEY